MPKSDDPLFFGPPNGVDAHSSAAHFSSMAAALKRLLTLGLMLALVVGTASQLMPSSVAHPDMGLHADMTGGMPGLNLLAPATCRTASITSAASLCPPFQLRQSR